MNASSSQAGKRKNPHPTDLHVGSRVRFHRMMRGMSQTTLGEQLGITFQQIQKYEKGTNRISASRLQKIANVIEVPISTFFENASTVAASVADQHSDFVLSSEGVKLNRAFVRIKNKALRQSIIDLVQAFAAP